MIAAKYGHFTDKQWRSMHTRIFTVEEVESELLLLAWFVIKPNLLLREVG